MYKHQKQNFIILICLFLGIPAGLFGFCTIGIWFYIFNNEDLAGVLTLISLSCILLGIIALILLRTNQYKFFNLKYHAFITVKNYGIKGVPNNRFLEFKIPIENLPNKLIFIEEKKGIFYTVVNEKKYVFDMRGWILKKYYIYEILLTMIQLRYCENKVNNLLVSLKTNYENMSIEFILKSKKQVLYSLTSNGYTILHSRYIKNTKNKIKFLNSIDNKGINQLYDLKV